MRRELQELASLGLNNPWAMLLAARNFVKTVWDPSRSDIGHGINSLISTALKDAGPQQIERLACEQPDAITLFNERYDPDITPTRLAKLPDGTLGREYARFIRANHIDPLATLLEIGTPTNPLQYLFRRAYKLHDLMHTALGVDASILGEVRIVSYSLGQTADGAGFASRAPAMALAVLFLHLSLRKPAQVKEAVRLAKDWMQIGEQARPHVTFRLEDHLDRPVPEVREMVLAPA